MTKKLFLLLTVVLLATAAQAQKTELSSVLGALDKTLEEAYRQAALNHSHRNKPATPPIGELATDTQAANTCAHCGKEITSDHQHCSETGFVGLCETAYQEKLRIAAEKADEDAKATQKAKDAEKYPHCTRCGEPVTHSEQECPATHYEERCTPAQPLVTTGELLKTTAPQNKNQLDSTSIKQPKMVTCPECARRVPVGTKCSHHHKPIVVWETEVPAERQDTFAAAEYHYVAKTPVISCGPICPDCGRTPEQVKIHGHNHK